MRAMSNTTVTATLDVTPGAKKNGWIVSNANIIEKDKQQSMHNCCAGHIVVKVGLLKHMQKRSAVVIGET
jgi:hypothetical protein